MPADPQPGADVNDLGQRLHTIEAVADRSYGVHELEPHLLSLLEFLRDRADEPDAEAELVSLTSDWPWPPGLTEVLEFTMRELRWASVRDVLTGTLTSDADFRKKDEARRVLEVYETDWPAGDIYRTYRHDAT